ncbi:MAG: hypothetical protein IPL33_06595 [Sphingobacteriales bacterium]|nr:hypothetical protein [Sphingobacteriales bacterium]
MPHLSPTQLFADLQHSAQPHSPKISLLTHIKHYRCASLGNAQCLTACNAYSAPSGL